MRLPVRERRGRDASRYSVWYFLGNVALVGLAVWERASSSDRDARSGAAELVIVIVPGA